MIDAATFLVRFPEFATTPSPLLEATLERAASSLRGPLGADEDELHGLETADLLASAPEGQMSRLENKTGAKTTYRLRVEQLTLGVAALRRVF